LQKTAFNQSHTQAVSQDPTLAQVIEVSRGFLRPACRHFSGYWRKSRHIGTMIAPLFDLNRAIQLA